MLYLTGALTSPSKFYIQAVTCAILTEPRGQCSSAGVSITGTPWANYSWKNRPELNMMNRLNVLRVNINLAIRAYQYLHFLCPFGLIKTAAPRWRVKGWSSERKRSLGGKMELDRWVETAKKVTWRAETKNWATEAPTLTPAAKGSCCFRGCDWLSDIFCDRTLCSSTGTWTWKQTREPSCAPLICWRLSVMLL